MINKQIKIVLWVFILILIAIPSVNAKTYEEPTNITGFQDLFQWNDRVLENQSGIGYLLLVFMVSFLLLKGFESAQAFTGCLYLTTITAISCWTLGILSFNYIIACSVLTGLVALLIMWLNN